MKTVLTTLAALIMATATAAAAEHSAKDPLQEALFPPELVLHFGKQIELSDEQREFIAVELAGAKESLGEPQTQLENEKRKIARLLEKSISGEAETQEALKRMFKYEQLVRLIHYRVLIRIKNHLSAGQRKRLQALRKDFNPKKAGPPPGLEKRLQVKFEKLKKGLAELADLGVSPEAVHRMMQGFQPLIEMRKFVAAEALLDEAIKKLDDPF